MLKCTMKSIFLSYLIVKLAIIYKKFIIYGPRNRNKKIFGYVKIFCNVDGPLRKLKKLKSSFTTIPKKDSRVKLLFRVVNTPDN